MRTALMLLLIAGLFTPLNAQQLLVLEKIKGNAKLKRIRTDEQLHFYTKEGKWEEISGFTDSSITFSRNRKTSRDTLYTWLITPSKRHPDGLLRKKQRVWEKDSITCRYDEVLLIRRPVFRSKALAHIAGWMMAGAVLAVPLLPVAAIDEGRKGVQNWLLFEAVLTGISGTALGLLSLQKKFTLLKKWKLKAVQPE